MSDIATVIVYKYKMEGRKTIKTKRAGKLLPYCMPDLKL